MLGRYSRENTVSSCQGRATKASLILSTLGCFTTVNIRKRMFYRHCYISFLQAQAVPNNLIQFYAELMKRTTKPNWIAIENVNNIDERRPKIVRNMVFDCH